jgi:hypothetical protein
MTVGKIKHQIRVTVDSDNPESRVIGILKLAGLFEAAGIHLASDLSTATSRSLGGEVRDDPAVTPNNQILATMVEVGNVAGDGKEHVIGHLPDGGTIMYRSMPKRDLSDAGPRPYPKFEVRKNDFDSWPSKAITDTAGEVRPNHLGRVIEKSRIGEGMSPEALAELTRGDIPGYEHNPMARAEHFEEVPGPIPASFVTTEHERSVQSNWPNPAPLGLVKYTGVVATDNYGESEPNYEYKIVGLGGHTGRSTLKEISLLTQVDKEVGPNGVRIEDLLAICSDHLSSLAACDQANQSQIDANKSIIKALHHLHGLTSLKHINPTGTLN